MKKQTILSVGLASFIAIVAVADAQAQGWRGGGGWGWGWGGGNGCNSRFLRNCQPADEAPVPALAAALGAGVSGLVIGRVRRGRRKNKQK